MTGPSLVVEPENDDAEPLDSWAGAGAVSSVADAHDAFAAGDPVGGTLHTAGAALDLLGVVANPLDELAIAGIGWLIEHISWLHEPLDALAGDPAQIRAQAQTWHNVAQQLGEVAAAYRSSPVDGWEGEASAAYRGAVEGYVGRLDEVAGHADRIASVLLVTGEGVGTVREIIRDAIAEFIWLVIQIVVLSGVLAFLTVGGSVAAGTVRIIERAVDLANDNIRRISELLDTLSAAGGTAGQLAGAMRNAAIYARVGTPIWSDAAGDVVDAADGVHIGDALDVGTALTGAAQDQREWDEPPA